MNQGGGVLSEIKLDSILKSILILFPTLKNIMF